MFSRGGGRQVTETRTYIDADGQRKTETVTYTEDDSGGGHKGFGSKFGGFGFGGGDFKIKGLFGGGSKGGGDKGGHTVKIEEPAAPTPRYSKGWKSTKRERPSPPPTDVGPASLLHGKNFEELKAQCLANGTLYEDPSFPACDTSIFYSKAPPRPFEWKRPHELCDDPKFFVGGASRFDIKQGELGDCWLLAAVASLVQEKEIFCKVVPQDQDFDRDDYCGIFHFRFWEYGKWNDVIVDDRLPTFYNKLVFMHSVDKNEFWTPLLEKAYAKLQGSYEALKGGATSEAMEDFTGGVCEMWDFRQGVPPNMFNILKKAFDRSSLMGCSIEAMPGQLEAELANGLIMGHAYTITNVKNVNIKTSRKTGSIPMIRVRNPWGNEAEWKGAWSDKSQEWKFIPEEERQRIGLTFDDDGEFWMAFSDFIKNFQKVEICNLGPDSLDSDVLDAKSKKKWETVCHEGAWKRRVNAGGCRNYLDTFWTNPQYRIDVVDPDDDDDEDEGTLIVGLIQKGRRKKRKEGLDLLTIGYTIYKLPDPNCGPLDMKYFKYNASVAKSPSFINMREVSGRHKLRPGNYCIIPTTFEPHQEGEFMVRVFSEKPNISNEIDEETGMADVKHDTQNYKYKQQAKSKVREEALVPVDDSGIINAVQPPEVNEDVQEDVLVRKRAPAVHMSKADEKENQKMIEAFRRIAGEDMEVDAYELMDILNAAFQREFTFDGFSSDTCRSMVAMMDADRSGKLAYEEFKTLWDDMRLWKNVFKQHDKDKSGNFNGYELRQAFHAVGFKVSNQTFNALVQRYSHKDGKIYFDDYIHCVVRLKTMFEIFKLARGEDGRGVFGLDEFIQTTMYS